MWLVVTSVFGVGTGGAMPGPWGPAACPGLSCPAWLGFGRILESDLDGSIPPLG